MRQPFSICGLAVAAVSLCACGVAPDGSSNVLEDREAASSPSAVSVSKLAEIKRKGYAYIHYVFYQPKYRRKPHLGQMVAQHVEVIVPDGVAADAPVFLHFGNEAPKNENGLKKLWKAYGGVSETIFVQIEHRGYGRSLSSDADQTVPDYVHYSEAIDDAHEVVKRLKTTYTGPWMVAGWSYGGGLVVEFADRYPNDVEVVLSSSGVFDWPFLNPTYEPFVKRQLGEAASAALASHVRNLEPAKLFDQNWLKREVLLSTARKVTQSLHHAPFLETFKKIVIESATDNVVSRLQQNDEIGTTAAAWRWARARSKRRLSLAEAKTMKWGWRVWTYQTCTQTGVFHSSNDPSDGIAVRKKDDWKAECAALFGQQNLPDSWVGWSQREEIAKLQSKGVTLIFVAGNQDPWSPLGLGTPQSRPVVDNGSWKEYETSYGRYFRVPQGQHCPDRNVPKLSQAIMTEMLRAAGVLKPLRVQGPRRVRSYRLSTAADAGGKRTGDAFCAARGLTCLSVDRLWRNREWLELESDNGDWYAYGCSKELLDTRWNGTAKVVNCYGNSGSSLATEIQLFAIRDSVAARGNATAAAYCSAKGLDSAGVDWLYSEKGSNALCKYSKGTNKWWCPFGTPRTLRSHWKSANDKLASDSASAREVYCVGQEKMTTDRTNAVHRYYLDDASQSGGKSARQLCWDRGMDCLGVEWLYREGCDHKGWCSRGEIEDKVTWARWKHFTCGHSISNAKLDGIARVVMCSSYSH